MDTKLISEKVDRGEAYLIDVRTKSEWDTRHAVGAILWDVMNYNEQNASLPSVDKEKEVYVYCRSGGRSEQAKMIFEDSGFTNVTNIGGLNDWIKAGGETK